LNDITPHAKDMNSNLLQTLPVFLLIFSLGCGSEGAKKATSSSESQNAPVGQKELLSRTLHPSLKLKSARFGPCKKSNTAWKVQRGDHELVLVFEKPATPEGKKILEEIVQAEFVAKGRGIPILMDGEWTKSGRLRFEGDVFVPGLSEKDDCEIVIYSNSSGPDGTVVFSKKIQVIAPPPRPPVASVFPQFNPKRLMFPPGWQAFESTATSFNDYDEADIPKHLATAKKYITSSERPHPHDLEKIGMTFIKCAAVKIKLGKKDEALDILEELQSVGGVLYDAFDNNKAFDTIRDDPRFKAVYEFGKAETNEEYFGRYLIRQPPLLTLDDFEKIKMTPPLPDLSGKVFVISTGGPHMFDDTALEESVKCGVEVHAIVSKGMKLKVPDGVVVHQTDLQPDALTFQRTPIVWFGGKDGNVVAFLRPFSGSTIATGIVEKLKTD
jgi:hypothetical protein